MKVFFNNESNTEKITEKAFTQGLLISFICIGICIVALCSLTYAWFTTESVSNSNTLTSGSFDLTAVVCDPLGDEIEPKHARPGEYTFSLDAGVYTVSLTRTPQSNVKGHCLLTIGTLDMRTDAILKGEGDGADFTFTLVITEPTSLTLESRWGIVAAPDVECGDVIDLDATNE